MPESVRDRCTKAHEYIFLLSKSERYFYDAKAISEASVDPDGSARRYKSAFGGDKSRAPVGDAGIDTRTRPQGMREFDGTRNRRSVWAVATRPYKGAHFATFPPALIEPCILAGSRHGDIVLDPFMGSGTTAQVALQQGRQYLGCELNPDYASLQQERIESEQTLFNMTT
jgi:DNA modification methylase